MEVSLGGGIVEFVILAQNLGQMWDLPPGTHAGTELPAEVYLLSPRAFNPVQHGGMSLGQSLGAGQQSGRKGMNGWLRSKVLGGHGAVACAASQPQPCVDFVVRSLPSLGC